jgi:hypothetical protein
MPQLKMFLLLICLLPGGEIDFFVLIFRGNHGSGDRGWNLGGFEAEKERQKEGVGQEILPYLLIPVV